MAGLSAPVGFGSPTASRHAVAASCFVTSAHAAGRGNDASHDENRRRNDRDSHTPAYPCSSAAISMADIPSGGAAAPRPLQCRGRPPHAPAGHRLRLAMSDRSLHVSKPERSDHLSTTDHLPGLLDIGMARLRDHPSPPGPHRLLIGLEDPRRQRRWLDDGRIEAVA